MSILIVIQHDNDSSKRDYAHTVSGEAKKCNGCKNGMELILQEPCLPNDYLTGWWYCSECSETAKLNVESSMFMQEEIEMKKEIEEIEVTTPLLLIDKEIYDAKGRLVAKCYRDDVGKILLTRLNSQPDLLAACKEALEIIQLVMKEIGAADASGRRAKTPVEKHLEAAITKGDYISKGG